MMITDTEPIIGWEAITGTTHPTRGEHLLAGRLWAARNRLIETGMQVGYFDLDGIDTLTRVAGALENAEPCGCVLPEQTCAACRLSAQAVSILRVVDESVSQSNFPPDLTFVITRKD